MGLRIMIVEDSPITREMLREMLLGLGHEVVAETDNMQEAIATYQRLRPDAVTMDLSLPKDDGLTILRALRKVEPDAKVFIISGNSQERIREEALKAGAVDVIAKPIEFDALQQRLALLGK
jgi:two-component system chemotaxis response regulator CheY